MVITSRTILRATFTALSCMKMIGR